MNRRKNLKPEQLSHDSVLAALTKANKPLNIDQILSIMRLPRREKKRVDSFLRDLATAGTVIRHRGSWHVPKNQKLIRGILSVQRSGSGFVLPESGESGNDIFINPDNMGEAWDEDLVELLILPGRSGPNREGRILKVISRADKPIAAKAVKKQGKDWVAVPQDAGIQAVFVAEVSELEKEVAEHDLLLLLPQEQISQGLYKAKAIKNLDSENSPATQEFLAKLGHGMPMNFSPAVLKEASSFPENPPMDSFKLLTGKEAEEKRYPGIFEKIDRSIFKDPHAKAGTMDALKRYDLRHIPFVTIDGADARDFDDAVYVEKLRKGYRLMVGIADVSYYVKEGTALDREAEDRGNSYYFPLSVEPMLPRSLSNGLCSLNPNKPRLAMVAELFFDDQGREEAALFYRAIIESKARLTYEDVFASRKDKDPKALKAVGYAYHMLDQAFSLAGLLAGKRNERGSLNFEIPEAQFSFDKDGQVDNIVPRVQNEAHKLIEEFMIAANEAVARFLTEHKASLLYRSHESPDDEKLAAFRLFIEQADIVKLPLSLKPKSSPRPGRRPRAGGRSKEGPRGQGKESSADSRPPSPKELMEILNLVKGSAQEYTVNRLLLRAMMQAKYSSETATHFGLASVCYCHFTSPIRRYADLLVHRALGRVISKDIGCMISKDWYLPHELKGNIHLETASFEKEDKKDRLAEKSAKRKKSAGRSKKDDKGEASFLDSVAEHINQTERTAQEAERETHKRLATLYLSNRVGEKFSGIISGVTDFGIFVELPSCLAEGMIRLGNLDDDYYEFYPERVQLRGKRTGKTFSLGQALDVVLTDVVLSRMEVNLLPVEYSDKEGAGKKGKAVRGRRENRRPRAEGGAKGSARRSGSQTGRRGSRQTGRKSGR